MTNNRLSHVIQFYDMLDTLEKRYGGKRTLSQCSEDQAWPERGVYFFFEPGEERTTSGTGGRVVRIGTHALKLDGETTLWNRLSQHQGTIKSGGGNHRGSVFRLVIGDALMRRDTSLAIATWGQNRSATAQIRQAEKSLENHVSRNLGEMSVLWLPIADAASPDSKRGTIERNTIALLSNFGYNEGDKIDPPSAQWLGRSSSSPKVKEAGLWNQHYVKRKYDPSFLDIFSELMRL